MRPPRTDQPAPTSEPALAQDQVRCATCTAAYRPRLTGGRCPICDTAAGTPAAGQSRFVINPEDRVLAIVIGATLLNIILLGLLVALVSYR